MKIVHICFTAPYTDNFGYQENILAKMHSKLGNEVYIITSTKIFSQKGEVSNTQAGRYFDDNSIRITRLNSMKLPNIFLEKFHGYRGFTKELESINPDIIFSHNFQYINIIELVRYIKKHKKVRLIVDSHADYVNSAHNFISREILHKIIYKKWAKLIEPYTEKFYATLPIRTQFLNEIYSIPLNKIELLVMGVDDQKLNECIVKNNRNELRKSLDISPEDFVVITGGKIDLRKNIHLLVDAIIKMPISTKLIIFGSFSSDVQEVMKYKLEKENIRNIGWLDSDDIYQYYIAADLAVFPGEHSVLWEQAVACGLPCIFKKWEGIQHVDVGGNCVFLDKITSQILYDNIQDIIDDKLKYEKMRNIALKEGIKNFSASHVAKRCIE